MFTVIFHKFVPAVKWPPRAVFTGFKVFTWSTLWVPSGQLKGTNTSDKAGLCCTCWAPLEHRGAAWTRLVTPSLVAAELPHTRLMSHRTGNWNQHCISSYQYFFSVLKRHVILGFLLQETVWWRAWTGNTIRVVNKDWKSIWQWKAAMEH